MPKLHKDYPDQLSLNVPQVMKLNLIAIAYLVGDKGKYAKMTRYLIGEAVERYIATLEPAKRDEFDEILSNLRLQITAGKLNI